MPQPIPPTVGAPLAGEQRYTYTDWERLQALPENANTLFELIGGRLYAHPAPGGKMTPPSYLHAFVVSILVEVLVLYLAQSREGRLFTDNTGYHLPTGDVLIPDLSVVTTDRLQPITRRGIQHIAPDLAVEVVSPSNSPEDLSDKVNAYLSAGVSVVWVVYPTTHSIDVYTRLSDGETRYHKLTLQDHLTGGVLLPGFSAALADIFPKTLEDGAPSGE